MATKNNLRKQKRLERRLLSPSNQKRASQNLTRLITKSSFYKQAKSIAMYLNSDGEVALDDLMGQALKDGKLVYLPVVKKQWGRQIRFARYRKCMSMRFNRFGIKEPRHVCAIKEKQIDLVLLPLVAFDEFGRRLGMGGGFYDKTFAYHLSGEFKRGKLVGVAHQCQQTQRLSVDAWDVPLHTIATDKMLIHNI